MSPLEQLHSIRVVDRDVGQGRELEELLDAAADYGRALRRRVTLECALIAGVNDGPEHADQLIRLARKGPFKVNLIPLNPIEGYQGERPQRERVAEFADRLWKAKIVAMAANTVAFRTPTRIPRNRTPAPP